MKTKVTEVIKDAKEALRMDRYMEFEEWSPAWMINEKGEHMDNPKRLKALKTIFECAKKELRIK